MFSVKIRKLKDEVEKFWGLTDQERERYTDLLKHKANLQKTYDYCSNDEALERILFTELSLVNEKIDFYNNRMKEGVA